MAVSIVRIGRRGVSTAALLALLAQAPFAPADGRAAASAPEPVRREQAAVPSPQRVAEAKLLLDREYLTALLEGIDQAATEIVLSAYLFRTIENAGGAPEAVLNGLHEAVRRGVRVDAVLERGDGNRGDLSRNNAATARRLKKRGIRVCLDDPERINHTKLVVIDRRYLLIGSHNLTQSALKSNREASVWIDSAPLAEEALRYLNALCPGGWR